MGEGWHCVGSGTAVPRCPTLGVLLGCLGSRGGPRTLVPASHAALGFCSSSDNVQVIRTLGLGEWELG